MFIKFVSVAFFLGIILVPTATAQNWEFTDFGMSMDVRGSASEDYSYSGTVVRTTDKSKPELKFSCSERLGLVATVAAVPLAERAKGELAKKQRKVQFRRDKFLLHIDDRKRENITWTYVKELQTYQTIKHSPAAKMLNAVIQGKGFVVDRTRIDPPPVDEAFTQFFKSCHVTSREQNIK